MPSPMAGRDDATAIVPRPTQLHHEAERALDDFAFFRRAYLGHDSLPWALELVAQLEAWTATLEKAYGVVNVAPGVGKSTLLAAYILWRIVRDRAVRCLYGSAGSELAGDIVASVRRYLEADVPLEPSDEDIAGGHAVRPWRVLADDFGRFKPLARGATWTQTRLQVELYDGALPAKKEPTLSSYGEGTKQLGRRFDVVVWDDLVDVESCSTPEQIHKLEKKWETEFERRLDPGGVMCVVGQKIGAGDLYEYLRKKIRTDHDTGDVAPMFHHVIFPAHFEDICQQNHDRKTAREWPYGCLLDPYRVPWAGSGGLRDIADNSPHTFEVVYQQRDLDTDDALVRDIWIKGGYDAKDDRFAPGCLDHNRKYGDLPANLGKAVRMATVDPSASRHWAVEDVVVARGESRLRILVDTFDGKMTADELLDFDLETREFKGIMHRWQQRSIAQGLPIKVWVIERNAAQRYLYAYSFVRDWQKKYNVLIWPHETTGKNKPDPQMGVQSLREPHRAGLWRYAYGDAASVRKTETIRRQLTGWPSPAVRTDQVMALWEAELHMPKLLPSDKPLPLLPRASWQRRRSA